MTRVTAPENTVDAASKERPSVLAVVPARGGSKGVPRKNLQPIGGVPMVARVRHVMEQLDFVDKCIISTDDPEIAVASGLDAPFMRPAEISGDLASAAEVARHALESAEEIDGVRYDVLLYLEPSAPMRRACDVEACFRKLISEDLDAVWTVSPVNPSHHPLKLLLIDSERLHYYDPRGADIVARQQLSPVYRRNGDCYALTRSCVLQHGFMGPKTGAVVTDDHHVSVDSELDIAFLNFVLDKGLLTSDD